MARNFNPSSRGETWGDGQTIARDIDDDGTSYRERVKSLLFRWTGAAWERWDGSISVNTSDIQIGAVEIKNATDDTRAVVTAGGAVKVDGSAVTQPVSGPLTDAQLRATAVPVSGPLTDAQLRATAVPVSTGKTMLFAAIAQGSAGTTQLVAADASNKIKVVSYVVVIDAAGSFKFTDGTADLSGAMPAAANGGVSAAGQPFGHLFETQAVNRPLNIVTVTGKAFGHIAYFKEA